jgi:hypothetical protein
MLRHLRLQSIGIAALCLLVLGSGRLPADEIPAARRLPPGVLLYLSVPDAVDLKDRFMESNFGQMIQDDSLNEFRAQFSEQWQEVSNKVQEEIGLSIAELTALLHGEATLAVVQPPGRSLGGVMLLEFGEHRDTLDTILEKARQAAEEDRATRTVETVESTEVTVFTRPEGEDDNGGPRKVAYFIKDQHLVISMGSTIDLLQDVLIRWDGEHTQTFADDEIFSTIMRNCHPSGAETSQFQWYFSPIDMFRSVAMLPQANRGGISPAMALGFLPALGLDRFKAIGGASAIGTEEFDSVTHTFVYVNQPTSGLVRFFEFPAVRQSPPEWVPAEVSSYTSANWDVTGAYEAVEAVVDFFQPPGTFANAINQLAQQGPRIHIKDDIVNSLTGRFQMFGEVPDEVEADSVQPGVFALELRDPDKLAGVLRRVADVSEGNLKTRDFRGSTIYEMDLPNLQGGAPQSMGVTVAKGQLFIATDVQLLESYLRIDRAEEPLANSTAWRRVSSHFPSETSIIGFGRPAAQLKPVYEQLRSGELDPLTDEVEIDFSTLPPFERLADYFTTTGSYAVPAENGALFVNFSLRRD